LLYWDIGGKIVENQKKHGWGKSIVETLAKDLQIEFPGVSGYSADNLWRMRKFYLNYANNPKLAPLVQEIAWVHNIIIEYALKDSKKPIAVASYRITSMLPKELRKELPSPEQIKQLLAEI